MFPVSAARVVEFQRHCLDDPAWPGNLRGERAVQTDVWSWIEHNHRCNHLLWLAEDEVRRTDLADAELVGFKRDIDHYNQQRNDAVERVDEHVLAALNGVIYSVDARQHSETAGAMIDRLSILALKIHHMRLQSLREVAGMEHVARCVMRLAILGQQRDDLAACLDRLLLEARTGRTYFKVYRQFKMYNDPQLNPALARGHAARAGPGGG